jgi:hypothetical protein
MNAHAKRFWHVRQHPRVQEDREKLKFYASLSGNGKRKRIRTRVCFINYGKTVLDDISMLESHDVVHAMSSKFFPVNWIRLMSFLKDGWLTLLFQTSPHGTRMTIGDLMSL